MPMKRQHGGDDLVAGQAREEQPHRHERRPGANQRDEKAQQRQQVERPAALDPQRDQEEPPWQPEQQEEQQRRQELAEDDRRLRPPGAVSITSIVPVRRSSLSSRIVSTGTTKDDADDRHEGDDVVADDRLRVRGQPRASSSRLAANSQYIPSRSPSCRRARGKRSANRSSAANSRRVSTTTLPLRANADRKTDVGQPENVRQQPSGTRYVARPEATSERSIGQGDEHAPGRRARRCPSARR